MATVAIAIAFAEYEIAPVVGKHVSLPLSDLPSLRVRIPGVHQKKRKHHREWEGAGGGVEIWGPAGERGQHGVMSGWSTESSMHSLPNAGTFFDPGYGVLMLDDKAINPAIR